MKKLSIIGSLVLLVFIVVSFIVTKIVYDASFPRYNRHDDTINATLRYSDMDEDYPRELVNFYSGDHRLQGYVYPQDEAIGLVVIAHGIGGGADSYLSYARWFIDHGWSVFMYDATGSFDSEGDTTRGFPQSLIDLEAALEYVTSDDVLSQLDLVLFGHSWGGYAVVNALHFDFDIKAVVSVAAPNQATEMVVEQARKMMGVFALTQRPFLAIYQRILFGSYAGYDAIDAINESTIPVMIIHGVNDDTVSYTGSAIIAKESSITNPNVIFKTMDEENRDGHNNLFRSDASLAYLEIINTEYRTLYDAHNQEIPYEIKQIFYAGIDRFLVQDLHEPLMQEIQAFYVQALD